jgi:hypothetical protein
MSPARQLANVLLDLLRRERDALAEFLFALADFDRKRAWSDLGHNSLFAFLVRDLGLSNGAAAYRKAAVELVQRFPLVLDAIREGQLCITTEFELAKVITDENAAEVLPRFFGTSKRDAQNVVAELAPRPVTARTIVTAVGATAPAVPAGVHDACGRLADWVRANSTPPTREGPVLSSAAAPVEPPAPAPVPSSVPARTVVDPRTAELSRVHLTVPRRLLEKLATARDALSHSHFGASDAEVLEVGLDLIIDRHRKRRGIGAKPRAKKSAPAAPPVSSQPAPSSSAPAPAAATTSADRSAPPAEAPPPPAFPPPPWTPRSRHVPAAVARAVWERDKGCCAWPLESGGVCASTYQIELDHIDGFALGGATTVERLRLLCKPHQDVHARALYGDDLMDNYTGPKGPGCSEPVAVYAPLALSAAARRSRRPRHTRTGPRSATSRRTCRTSPRSPRSAC